MSLFATWNGRPAMMSQGSFSTMMVSVVCEDQRKFESYKRNLTKEVEKQEEELKIPVERNRLYNRQRGSAHFLVKEAEISTGGEPLSISTFAWMGSAERWWETTTSQVMWGTVSGGEGEEEGGMAGTAAIWNRRKSLGREQ
jgi:hypothetical protein